MNIEFPSREFDDAVAAVCHGLVSDEQARALNMLLLQNAAARDDYILRLELHSRLASQLDLFVPAATHDVEAAAVGRFAFSNGDASHHPRDAVKRKIIWTAALAACVALVAAIGWSVQRLHPSSGHDTTPSRVASDSDWKPSVTNLPGENYPRINLERRAQFRIYAPNAEQVSVNIGSPLTVTKSDDGVWTITTSPLGIGFHFYRLLIDGESVADPATKIFRGGGGDWHSSGIEVPTGEDFFEVKDVPHGEVSEQRYFSQTTGESRRIFVYTPPDYKLNTAARYPVLYLLPGAGEDETCWSAQGRVGQILDNLIAEQKAKPMVVVMDGGVARKPNEPNTTPWGPRVDPSQRFLTLDEVFVNDLVPMIDRTYRTIADGSHRAVAGLSLGGMQALAIVMRHPERFASIGDFSGAGGIQGSTFDPQISHDGVMADADAFNRSKRVFFLSVGAGEPEWMLDSVKRYHDTLQAAGINHVFYISPDTAHEWHTWRRSFREFASLLFKD
jgi:enterochelin esterase-like enzyme